MKKSLFFALVLLIARQNAVAQWEVQDSHFPAAGIGVLEMKAVSANVAWAVGTDMSGPSAVAVQSYTRTTDGGLTWLAGTIAGASGYNTSSISAIDANTAWVSLYLPLTTTGQTEGRIYKTINGGQSWVQQATNAFNLPQGFINKVHFFDSDNGLAIGNPVGGYFEIYTTQNGGDTWTRVPQANLPNPIGDERAYINVFSAIGPKFWFGTTRGRVFISSDMGQNWTAAATGMTRADVTLPLITNLDFKDANFGLIQNDSTMRRTTDGGLTWSPNNHTGPVHIYDLRYIPGTPGTWISTGANYQINDVGSSMSVDNGLTWTELDDSVEHTAIDFIDPTIGWTGGINSSVAEGGMFKWTGLNALANRPEMGIALLHPNPAQHQFMLTSVNRNLPAEVEMRDITGRLVTRKHIPASGPESGYRITLEGTEAGVYLVTVRQQNQVQQGKLLIQ